MYDVYVYQFPWNDPRVELAWSDAGQFWPSAWLSIGVDRYSIYMDSRSDQWLFFNLKWGDSATVSVEQWV